MFSAGREYSAGGREYPPDGEAPRDGVGGRSDHTLPELRLGAEPAGPRFGAALPDDGGCGVNWCHPLLLLFPRLCAWIVSCAGRPAGAAPRFIGDALSDPEDLENVCHPELLRVGCAPTLGRPMFALLTCRADSSDCEPRELPFVEAVFPEVGGRGTPNRCQPDVELLGRAFDSAGPRLFA
jgi:hypothetical protein